MTYRDDLAALAARHSSLEQEVAQKTRELERASALLEEATAKSRQPVLDNIRVAQPCTASWAKMTGDERVKHCGECQQNVYNLSELTRDEAEALILAKEGRLCVRYYQRADGMILLKDCLVGIRRRRKRRIIAAGAAAMLAAGGALAVHALTDDRPEVVMGTPPAQPVAGRFDMDAVASPPTEAAPAPRELTMGQMVVEPHRVLQGKPVLPKPPPPKKVRAPKP